MAKEFEPISKESLQNRKTRLAEGRAAVSAYINALGGEPSGVRNRATRATLERFSIHRQTEAARAQGEFGTEPLDAVEKEIAFLQKKKDEIIKMRAEIAKTAINGLANLEEMVDDQLERWPTFADSAAIAKRMVDTKATIDPNIYAFALRAYLEREWEFRNEANFRRKAPTAEAFVARNFPNDAASATEAASGMASETVLYRAPVLEKPGQPDPAAAAYLEKEPTQLPLRAPDASAFDAERRADAAEASPTQETAANTFHITIDQRDMVLTYNDETVTIDDIQFALLEHFVMAHGGPVYVNDIADIAVRYQVARAPKLSNNPIQREAQLAKFRSNTSVRVRKLVTDYLYKSFGITDEVFKYFARGHGRLGEWFLNADVTLITYAGTEIITKANPTGEVEGEKVDTTEKDIDIVGKPDTTKPAEVFAPMSFEERKQYVEFVSRQMPKPLQALTEALALVPAEYAVSIDAINTVYQQYCEELFGTRMKELDSASLLLVIRAQMDRLRLHSSWHPHLPNDMFLRDRVTNDELGIFNALVRRYPEYRKHNNVKLFTTLPNEIAAMLKQPKGELRDGWFIGFFTNAETMKMLGIDGPKKPKEPGHPAAPVQLPVAETAPMEQPIASAVPTVEAAQVEHRAADAAETPVTEFAEAEPQNPFTFAPADASYIAEWVLDRIQGKRSTQFTDNDDVVQSAETILANQSRVQANSPTAIVQSLMAIGATDMALEQYFDANSEAMQHILLYLHEDKRRLLAMISSLLSQRAAQLPESVAQEANAFVREWTAKLAKQSQEQTAEPISEAAEVAELSSVQEQRRVAHFITQYSAEFRTKAGNISRRMEYKEIRKRFPELTFDLLQFLKEQHIINPEPLSKGVLQFNGEQVIIALLYARHREVFSRFPVTQIKGIVGDLV